LVAGLSGVRHDADPGVLVVCQPLCDEVPETVADRLHRGAVDALWFRAMRQGAFAGRLVAAAVQVVDLEALQQGDGLTADFFRGAVVEIELPGATADVDAATAHAGLVLGVEALVSFTDEHQVVRRRRHQGADQLQRLWAEVLRFVHVGKIQGLAVPLSQQRAGVPLGVVELLQALGAEEQPILFEDLP
jgi:hypothetical protein